MKHTLLVADDSQTVQRIVEMACADADVDVVAVADGELAIAQIADHPPDIVLADIAMPRRSGYDVAAFVKGRADLAHIPVVLMAGMFETADDSRAREVGCDEVLVKPLKPLHVIERVKYWLHANGSSAAAPPPSVDLAEPTPAAFVLPDTFEGYQLDDTLDGAGASALLSEGESTPHVAHAARPAPEGTDVSKPVPDVHAATGDAAPRVSPVSVGPSVDSHALESASSQGPGGRREAEAALLQELKDYGLPVDVDEDVDALDAYQPDDVAGLAWVEEPAKVTQLPTTKGPQIDTPVPVASAPIPPSIPEPLSDVTPEQESVDKPVAVGGHSTPTAVSQAAVTVGGSASSQPAGLSTEEYFSRLDAAFKSLEDLGDARGPRVPKRGAVTESVAGVEPVPTLQELLSRLPDSAKSLLSAPPAAEPPAPPETMPAASPQASAVATNSARAVESPERSERAESYDPLMDEFEPAPRGFFVEGADTVVQAIAAQVLDQLARRDDLLDELARRIVLFERRYLDR